MLASERLEVPEREEGAPQLGRARVAAPNVRACASIWPRKPFDALLDLRAERVEKAGREDDLEELLLVHVVGWFGDDLERGDDVRDHRVVRDRASLREATRNSRR